jgi:hypothetical protein
MTMIDTSPRTLRRDLHQRLADITARRTLTPEAKADLGLRSGLAIRSAVASVLLAPVVAGLVAARRRP